MASRKLVSVRQPKRSAFTASKTIDLPRAGPLKLKLDVINVGDAQYFIRDGQGIGVGAPQYGPRRGFFLGITKTF